VKVGFGALVLAFLVLGVLGGVAFGGGVLYGRQTAPQPKVTAAAAPAAGVGGATGLGAAAGASPAAGGRGGAGGGGGAGGLGAGNFTAGAVDSINGDTIVLRTATGTTQNVQLNPATKVETTVSGSTSDLKPGAVVCIQGTPNDSGQLTALTIDVAPSCASLLITSGGGGGAGGAQRGGAGGARASSPTPTH
jgi:hypothetical protein